MRSPSISPVFLLSISIFLACSAVSRFSLTSRSCFSNSRCVRSNAAISGSVLSWDADGEGYFFCTLCMRRAGMAGDRFGGFSERIGEGDGSLALLGALDGDDDGPLRGDLKGDRNGFESVLEAASIRRFLAAGVYIFVVISIVLYASADCIYCE